MSISTHTCLCMDRGSGAQNSFEQRCETESEGVLHVLHGNPAMEVEGR